MKTIRILDTTLRDGEQSPGCSMDLPEKLEICAHLEALRVDVIEAGFAVASPDDFAAVRAIAAKVKDCAVASLARAVPGDIDRAWEAVRHAASPLLHIFLATSPIHMQYKLKMTPDEVLTRIGAMVAHAKKYCRDVEFSAEDASRSDPAFLAAAFGAAIRAGATIINVPDTVGYAAPQEMFELITFLRANVPGLDDVILSVHCHNDLGLAAANTLAAIRAGALQAECTLGGIGERAGNASLEELALTLHVRSDYYGARTNINTRKIYRACQTLSSILGTPPSPNKPVIGANAFAHEAGIHQHGVMENRQTYEIMRPEDIGIPQSKMVLGKHSGRHAFEGRLSDLGFTLTEPVMEKAFERFKLLADRKKVVSDDDLIALIRDKDAEISGGFALVRFIILSGSTVPATATVKLSRDGETFEEASTGDGPINAAFNAIDRIVQSDFSLLDYSLRSVTEGEDALGEAVVKLKRDHEVVTGRGLSTDILEASIKAYLGGVNRLLIHKNAEA